MRGLRQSLVAVVFTSLFACTVVSAERVQTPAERAEFIATTLRQTPRWWQVPQTDVKERARITDIYVKLAHYPNEDLRAGINLLLDESWPRSMMDRLNPTGALDKVFAFLRVVFDVPPTLDRADRLYQTFGNPIVGETAEAIDFLWPYTIDRHGKLRLTGTLGMYMGQPPDLTEEFDTMARTLNRRFPPTAEYMAHLEQHEPFQQGYERHKSECAKTGNVALITRTTPDGNPASFTCVSPTDPRYRAQHVMEQEPIPTDLGPVLQALIGHDIAVATNLIGGPQSEPIIDGDVVYEWGSMTLHSVPHTTLWDKDRTSACSIQLFTDPATRTIKRFAWTEKRGGCWTYLGKLDAPLFR
jgi:hypothetical protein